MPMEKTFRELMLNLRGLGERVQELGITVNQDRPKSNDAALVDDFEYAVFDVTGWLNEALGAAVEAHRAVEEQVDLSRARRALAACQEKFRRVEDTFSTNLFAYERVKDLTRFGRERRGEWPAWAAMVRVGIEHCRKPAGQVRDSIIECWQEMAERGGPSISVHATNIGQIAASAPAEDAGER